jgi:hypothetical protein
MISKVLFAEVLRKQIAVFHPHMLLWCAAELARFLVIPQGGIFTNGERLLSSSC